jgi:hypothetical protein
MSGRDPQRLEYANRETDADVVDAAASNCFVLGLFAPPLMILFGVAGYGVAWLSSLAMGVFLPHQMAVFTGVIVGGVVTAVLPVVGLRMGIASLRRMGARASRNRWQAVAGISIHSLLLAGLAVVLYCCLC